MLASVITVIIGSAGCVAPIAEPVGGSDVVMSVTISPPTFSLKVGESVQLLGEAWDVDGIKLPEKPIAWQSDDATIASVNATGMVTGQQVGSTTIGASSGGIGTEAAVTVLAADPGTEPPPPPPPPPPTSLSELPLATGQTPRFTAVQFPAAGGSYADPLTGVRVWRVTDAQTASGSLFEHYYGTANHISLPYESTKYHVLFIRDVGGTPMVADVARGVGISNVRTVPVGAVQRAAFSRVSPHILYYVAGNTIYRYNVQTMALENTAPFPKTLTRGNFESMLVSETDEWFSFMGLASSPGMHAWNRLTDQQRSNAANAKDQYALTAGGYVLVVAGAVYQWNLATGAFEATGMATESHVGHPDGMAGLFVARDATTREIYRFDPVTKQRTVLFGPAAHANGSEHLSGRWYQGTGTTQWALGSFFGGDAVGLGGFSLHAGQIYKTTSVSFDWAENKVGAVLQGAWGSGRWLTPVTTLAGLTEGSFFWESATRTLFVWQHGGGTPAVKAWDPRPSFSAITFFRLDGSEHRVLAHHYSSAGTYYAQPRAVISPDGRIVMWTSDMNGSARRDIFVAEVP